MEQAAEESRAEANTIDSGKSTRDASGSASDNGRPDDDASATVVRAPVSFRCPKGHKDIWACLWGGDGYIRFEERKPADRLDGFICGDCEDHYDLEDLVVA